MFNGTNKRLHLLADCEKSTATRSFAFLEVFCCYFSLLTLVVLLGQIIMSKMLGHSLPESWNGVLQVSLTAAVGFLTNWLAIEMLFKPYDPIRWLWIWPQGLVPRNKTEIGVKAGEKISSELLNPEAISKRLCEIVSNLLQTEATKKEISDHVLNFIRNYEDSIIEYLIPVIESSLARIIKQNITPDKFRTFWDKEISPRLASEEVRTFLTDHIVLGLKKHSPMLVENIKRWLREYVKRYVNNNFLGLGADLFADGLVAFIDWKMAEKMINDKIKENETQETIKNVLLSYVEDFHRWINSSESNAKIDGFIAEFRDRIEQMVRNYLKNEIPVTIKSILVSPKLWIWLNSDFIPSIRPQFESYIREKIPAILNNLDYKEIISDSIEKQDVREFHKMVNDVAAEHLGAIQVLGFFLGGIIGLLQVAL